MGPSARFLSHVLPLGLLIALAGCATYEGARLYGAGTKALDGGDTALAIRRLEQAARLVPEASEIQNHLGLAYQEAGRDADARHAFERAVELDCGNEAARTNLRAARARGAGETVP